MAKQFKNSWYFILIREIRPRQWLKNVLIFAPILFGKRLFDPQAFYLTVLAFIAFCFAISATYIINDTVDAPKDRLHPIKKNRPIASGLISERLAVFYAALFFLLSLSIAFFASEYLFYMIVGYLALQIMYSFYLKNFIIIDALTVSLGFILRVFAVGVASNT